MHRRWIVGLAVVVGILLIGRAVSLAQREAKVLSLNPQTSARWTQPGQPAPARIVNDDGLPRAEPAANAEDRMAAFDGFLGRSRKEVDESIQSLSQEEEKLKARLQNVQSALVRWRAVAGALDQASGGAMIVPAPEAEPAQLEPIAPSPAAPPASQPAGEVEATPSPAPVPAPPPSVIDLPETTANPSQPRPIRVTLP
jgi:hypothetical protein